MIKNDKLFYFTQNIQIIKIFLNYNFKYFNHYIIISYNSVFKDIIKIYHWQLENNSPTPEYYLDKFVIFNIDCNYLLLAYTSLKNIKFNILIKF